MQQNIIIQAHDENNAFKLTYLFKKQLKLFPDMGKQVLVEQCKHNPCLVDVQQVEISAEVFMNWFVSSFVRQHCARIFYFSSLNSNTAESFQQALAQIVQTGAQSDAIRLVCYPKTIKCLMEKELPQSFVLHTKEFTSVLQIVQVDEKLFKWGYIPATALYRQSNQENKIAGDSCSRAVNKLKEAVLIAGVDLAQAQCAIDIGAAPGSWSNYLSNYLDLVIAIDPGQIQHQQHSTNVKHIQLKSQEAHPQVQQYLLHHCNKKDEVCDLLMCDMNRHPGETIQIVNEYLSYVKQGGVILVTMKFFGHGRDKSRAVEEFKQVMGSSVNNVECVWLLGNTIHERMLIAFKQSQDVQ